LRAPTLDHAEREAMTDVLEQIERAARAVATGCGADIRVEWDHRGKFPLVAFRAHGFTAVKDVRVAPGRDM
jgi:hypothetical protein